MPKQAIIHVDGDAFFASCEQALNPSYRGQPVITGLERGIVSAASYEAKAYGIQRGVPLWEVKQRCPQAIIVASDYESYSLFSKRMFNIIRKFTPEVEEYGIDEAFANLTGLRRPLHKSYPQIAAAIKQQIEQELGISVSVGLAYNKLLAKIASKWNKPSGFTVINRHNRSEFLQATPVGKLWGIGYNTTNYLNKYGIQTAEQLAQRSQRWVEQYLTKPHQELWQELHGTSIWPVHTASKRSYQSISKTKTFTPPSSQASYVFAQLSKNVENACIKARRHSLAAQEISIFLKTQDFQYHSFKAKLNRATAWPTEMMQLIEQLFQQAFQANTLYRSTGVILLNLQPQADIQLNLFEEPLRITQQERIFAGVDAMAKKYGKHTLMLGSSLPAHTQPDTRQIVRQDTNLKPASKIRLRQSRKFLNLPLLAQQLW